MNRKRAMDKIRSSFGLVGLLLFFNMLTSLSFSQSQTIARTWNEVLLHAIRTDFARPTVHARNLYHLSLAHYDCFAALSPERSTFLIGKEINGFQSPFEGFPIPSNIEDARHEAICYASYRILKHRFQNSPGYTGVLFKIDSIMSVYNYPTSDTSTNYLQDGSSALGNYIAEQIIMYGYQDGANEANNYENTYYQVTNPPIEVEEPGNPSIIDPNHWQAISLTTAIDQSGNQVSSTPPHLSPEWGNVDPFAMNDTLISTYSRNGNDYQVYLDPGEPAYIDTTDTLELNSLYKWNFCMVSVWQSHLDPTNGVMIDISPASRGNLSSYPQTKEDHPGFYDFFNGGVQQTTGHAVNPVTGSPYTPQIVPLGDYARVLAEFWADGLDSETPPGHWFEILHTVIDDPQFVKQWMGTGDTLSDLEYDIRAQFVLGGAMHDAAVASWSVKGWYDYLRPVSAIRYMARLGQSSDTNQVNFHPGGIPLIPGYIELVEAGDPLEGANQEHIGKVKLYTWKGPDHIGDPETDYAGVGWILAENWWPYQRPTFVTPPFAGYVSGHSTFSRTAANVLTYMTGSPYFPGGIGEFHAEQNEFLEFEDGPSVDITLQWATYQDAADECSLSRIWGGIHPPVDDIPGRLIGDQLGSITFNHGNSYISNTQPLAKTLDVSDSTLNINDIGNTLSLAFTFDTVMSTGTLPQINFPVEDPTIDALNELSAMWINDSTYEVTYELLNLTVDYHNIVVQIDSAQATNGKYQNPRVFSKYFYIDTDRPAPIAAICSDSIINDSLAGSQFSISITVDEPCDTSTTPTLDFLNPTVTNTLAENLIASGWLNDTTYAFTYDVLDEYVSIDSIYIEVNAVYDVASNPAETDTFLLDTRIDTREPGLLSYSINDTLLNRSDIGSNALMVDLTFDKRMNTTSAPTLVFSTDTVFTDPLTQSIQSNWSSDTTCTIFYHLTGTPFTALNTDILLSDLSDLSGNSPSPDSILNALIIDTERPEIDTVLTSSSVVFDGNTGSSGYTVDIEFSERMNMNQLPFLEAYKGGAQLSSMTYNPFESEWLNDSIYRGHFDVTDDHIEVDSLSLAVNFGEDQQLNFQLADSLANVFDLDTRNPSSLVFNANTYNVTNGTQQLAVLMVFDEAMDENTLPGVTFSNPDANTALIPNTGSSQWYNNHTYEQVFDVDQIDLELNNVYVILDQGKDKAGNIVMNDTMSSAMDINLSALGLDQISPTSNVRVYPNPVSQNEIIYIHLPKNDQVSDLIIHDINGREIHRESIQPHVSWHEVRAHSWTEGMYFLSIDLKSHVFQTKIVVTNE